MKVFKKFDLLINIDESSFTWFTKKNFSWIPKGRKQIIKNICFRNSCSLITAILTTGGVLAAKSTGWINSSIFIDFLKELVKFIKDKEQFEQENYLIMLDNASIHRSDCVKAYLEMRVWVWYLFLSTVLSLHPLNYTFRS